MFYFRKRTCISFTIRPIATERKTWKRTRYQQVYPNKQLSETAGSNYERAFSDFVQALVNASVNSKHQHPPGLTPGNFFKVVKFPAPGQKIFAKLLPRGKELDKNPAPGDNFVDLQDNFAMIVKPFAFFWYCFIHFSGTLAWLSSSFFKDYKACEYKISQ